MAKPTNCNAIWIELDIRDGEQEHNEKQCELANKLLRKLFATRPDYYSFFISKFHKTLHLYTGTEYHECGDNGEWFNLDHLAGEKS